MAIQTSVVRQASRQGGYISRAQLYELGLSPRSVDQRLDAGDLTRISRGIYRIFDSSDHKDLIRGATLALPDAVASHQSAAHLLGFPVLPKLEPTVTVHSRTTHVFPGVIVRRCSDIEPNHLTRVDDIRLTNVARTVFDLAGILEFDVVDRVAEALIIAKRLKVNHLDALLRKLGRRGKRGTASVRLLVARATPGSVVDPTILERMGRKALVAGGLELPVAEYPLPWDPSRRFDDAYPSHRLAIEWDSRSWHSQRSAMDSDRKRDREAAMNDWVIVRFTWQDVKDRPAEVAASVTTLLQMRAS